MRVRPSIGIGIGLAVGYMVVFGVMFKLMGVGYDDIAVSAGNALKAIIIPESVAIAMIAVVVTFFGWWKPVLRDRRRAGGWLIAVPIVAAVLLLAGVDYGNLGKIDSALLLSLGVGTLLVGISEELMFRGLVVVSFRSSMREVHVWVWSSVAFGLLHSMNALLGHGVAATVQQVLVTMLIGSMLYVVRRTTGWLLVPMAIHALWDFSVLTQGDKLTVATIIQWLIIGLTVLALTVGRHHLFGTADDPVDETIS